MKNHLNVLYIPNSIEKNSFENVCAHNFRMINSCLIKLLHHSYLTFAPVIYTHLVIVWEKKSSESSQHERPNRTELMPLVISKGTVGPSLRNEYDTTYAQNNQRLLELHIYPFYAVCTQNRAEQSTESSWHV